MDGSQRDPAKIKLVCHVPWPEPTVSGKDCGACRGNRCSTEGRKLGQGAQLFFFVFNPEKILLVPAVVQPAKRGKLGFDVRRILSASPKKKIKE